MKLRELNTQYEALKEQPFNYGEWMDLGYQYLLNGFPDKAKEIWKYAAWKAHELDVGNTIREVK